MINGRRNGNEKDAVVRVGCGWNASGGKAHSMPCIVPVSAKQWTGLGQPYGVAIGNYDNDGLNDLAIAERDIFMM